jgi:hypothetical protein
MSETPSMPTGQPNLLATFFVRHALWALDAAGVQEAIRLDPVYAARRWPNLSERGQRCRRG